MIRPVFIALVFAVAVNSSALAAMSAKEFVAKAATGGMFEVQSSELALDRSKTQGIRDFAQEMVKDHGKANAELKGIAQKEKLSVPSKLDDEHSEKMTKLRQAKEDFDSTYVSIQTEAHEKAIALFETYAAEGDNQSLKNFAAKTLPVLKDHHEDITALAGGAKMTR